MTDFLLAYSWVVSVAGGVGFGWVLGAWPRKTPPTLPRSAVLPLDPCTPEERVRALLNGPEWTGGDQPW